MTDEDKLLEDVFDHLKPKVERFGIGALPVELTDDSSVNVITKVYTGLNGLVSYYIRVDIRNRLFNHLEYLPKKDKVTKGKLKKVNKKCYDYYIEFLKTNNKIWYSKAERESLNV